jgi:hypothetical protein
MADQVKEKNESKTGVSLAEAKKYLQRNDLSDIAKEEGLKRGQISNVLHGRSKNFSVVEKILLRAERNKALMERAKSIAE